MNVNKNRYIKSVTLFTHDDLSDMQEAIDWTSKHSERVGPLRTTAEMAVKYPKLFAAIKKLGKAGYNTADASSALEMDCRNLGIHIPSDEYLTVLVKAVYTTMNEQRATQNK